MSKEIKIGQEYSLYDYVPIGICIIDKDYNVRYWNKCLYGWTGIKKENIIGKNLLDSYPHLSEPVYKLRIDLMFVGHPPTIFSSLLHKYFFPVKITDKDYQVQSATLTSIPSGIEGQYHTLIAIENDTKLYERVRNYRQIKNKALQEIQKRKEAEEELKEYSQKLEETNATKDKFFSIIAHDLKNPLSGFLGLTQMLTKDISNFSLGQLQKLSTQLDKSANSLFKLLENLLEWARIQNGNFTYNPDICILPYLINQNIEIVKSNAAKKYISVKSYIPEDLSIIADVSMLNTVFRNLISNAVKFTRLYGRVEIGVHNQDDNEITFFIKDNGIGMDEDLINNLFRIDKKVSRLGTEGESSTGLGLLLCKEFIDIHKGRIEVESKVNSGSTFLVTLPIIKL